jgi:uncharacterized protein
MSYPNLAPDQLIRALHLQPLAGEGGLFVQTYRSTETISEEALPERYAGRDPRDPKPFGTAIFYLLTAVPGSFSALHRLPTDEIWHFYLGDPLEMTLLFPGGSSRQVILGQDVLNGQFLQFTVPRGVWQGARVAPQAAGLPQSAGTIRAAFSLLGTTMAPGFTPDDFEIGDRDTLLAEYPHERERILVLTR